MTAIKLIGERPWDPKARGEAPSPVEVELRNSMIRGPQTTIYCDSRQAAVRVENSIVGSPGTLVHLFHTRPLEFAHHRLLLEIGACTLDLEGPLVTIDCRPFDLDAVPLQARIRSTLVASGSVGGIRSPLLLWRSPVQDQRLSTAIHWTGEHNCYFQRGDALQAKSAAGPVSTYVQSPADWQRVGLGEETDWLAATKGVALASGPWHRRAPSGYTFDPSQAANEPRSRARGPRIGAEPKQVANPRALPAR